MPNHSTNLSTLCDQLAQIVESIPQYKPSDLTDIAYALSPAERRMFSLVAEYEQVTSSELFRLASVGNISVIARRINAKFERHGDPRRIESIRKRCTDENGQSVIESIWIIVDGDRDEQR